MIDKLKDKYPTVGEGCPKNGFVNKKWTKCSCWKHNECTDVEHFVSAGDESMVPGLGKYMLCYSPEREKKEDKVNPENKCANLFEEVPFEHDALNIMFGMQNDLQIMYGKKRGSITPDSKDIKLRIKESMYHFNCFVAEYFELMDRFYNDGPNSISPVEKMEMQYEIIDMWHFLMNIFLYLDLNKFDDIDIHDLYPLGISVEKFDETAMNNIWASICFNFGGLLDNLPYKYWKTYDKIEIDIIFVKAMARDIIENFFKLALVFDIDKEKFYSLYVSKNKENFARQKRGY